MRTSGPRLPSVAYLVAVCLLAAGCSRRAWVIVDAEPGIRDLDALADRIDPGPLDPLLREMPDWMGPAFGLDIVDPAGQVTPEAVADLAGRILQEWTTAPAISTENLQILWTFLRYVVILEQHDANGSACDARCLSVRADIYNLLDVPWFADPDNFFGEMFDVVGPALGNDRTLREDAEAAIDFVRRIFREAPLHHRRVASRLLREAPASEETTRVLAQLAARESREERFGRASEMYRLVVERPGGSRDRLRWRELATSCYQSLRLDCGDSALARARELAGDPPEPDESDRLRECENLRQTAREVMACGEPRSFENSLVLAGHLIALGQLRRARELLGKLHEERPRDARPFAGLAKAALADNLHSREAARLVREAADLENQDQDFYEVAVGMAFGNLIAEVIKPAAENPDRLPDLMAPFLERVHGDIEGLSTFDRRRADILRVIVNTGAQLIALAKQNEAGLPGSEVDRVFTKSLRTVESLQAAYPLEPDVMRLMYLLARVVGDREVALAILGAEPPRDELREVQVLRATVLLALAVIWQDPALLSRSPALLRLEPPPPDVQWNAANLHADSLALRARLRPERALWARAEAGYRSLLEHAGSEQRPRLLNNLGVTLYEQGRVTEAVDQWSASIRDGARYRAPDLNLIVAQPGTDAVARLDSLAESQEKYPTGYQARAWALHLQGTDANATRRELDQRKKLIAGENPFGPPNTGAAGVVLAETFKIGFGYSTTKGLTTQLDLEPASWLLLPSPSTRNVVSP